MWPSQGVTSPDIYVRTLTVAHCFSASSQRKATHNSTRHSESTERWILCRREVRPSLIVVPMETLALSFVPVQRVSSLGVCFSVGSACHAICMCSAVQCSAVHIRTFGKPSSRLSVFQHVWLLLLPLVNLLPPPLSRDERRADLFPAAKHHSPLRAALTES